MSLTSDIKTQQEVLIDDNTTNNISPLDVRGALSLILDNLDGLTFPYYEAVVVVDVDGQLRPATSLNSGGSWGYNEAGSSTAITAAGGGYSGIYWNSPSFIKANTNYVVKFRVKRSSGDVGKEWRVGRPSLEGGHVSFIPNGSYQDVLAIVNQGDAVDFGMFFTASNDVTNETIEIQNFTVTEINLNEKFISDSLDNTLYSDNKLTAINQLGRLDSSINIVLNGGTYDVNEADDTFDISTDGVSLLNGIIFERSEFSRMDNIRVTFEAKQKTGSIVKWGIGKISVDGLFGEFTPTNNWDRYTIVINLGEFQNRLLFGELETGSASTVSVRGMIITQEDDINTSKIKSFKNRKLIIDGNGLPLSYANASANAGGVLNINTVDDVYEVTANGGGFSGLRLGAVLPNKNVIVSFDVRLKTGSSTEKWIVGRSLYSDNFQNFTIGTEWERRYFYVRSESLSSTDLIITGNVIAATNTLEFRNVEIREQTQAGQDNNAFNCTPRDNFDLQSELNKYEIVYIPQGTHLISEQIDIPSGRTVIGVKGKSILKFDNTPSIALNIGTSSNITLTDFKIEGSAPDTPLQGGLNPVAPGVIDTFTEAYNENNVGTHTGLRINGGERVKLDGLEITNFDAYGLHVSLSGKAYVTPNQYHNLYLNNNYCGLKTDNEAERASIAGCMITLNQIGWYMDSGTNMMVNCSLNANRVGLVMGDGVNHAHGVISNVPFTHCSLYGIVAYQVSTGQLFNGCKIGYGDVYLYKSRGISFQSGQFVSTLAVTIDGGWFNGISEDGIHSFNNNSSSSIFVSFPVIGSGQTTRKNNFFIDGSDPSALNN